VRLSVIEDEDRLSGILKSKLGGVGFTVDVAGSTADAGAALEPPASSHRAIAWV
jgi:hypothetical protein